MSEKEQVEALRLLREWMAASANVATGIASAADAATQRELRERTEQFLTLKTGARRRAD